MRCHFLGGNLDHQVLDIDDRDISTYREILMCSPPRDSELVRSHGWCVYADTTRTQNIDGQTVPSTPAAKAAGADQPVSDH